MHSQDGTVFLYFFMSKLSACSFKVFLTCLLFVLGMLGISEVLIFSETSRSKFRVAKDNNCPVIVISGASVDM